MSTARYYDLAAGKACILPPEEWDPSFEKIQVTRGIGNSDLSISGIRDLIDRRQLMEALTLPYNRGKNQMEPARSSTNVELLKLEKRL